MADLKIRLIRLRELSQSIRPQMPADLDPVERAALQRRPDLREGSRQEADLAAWHDVPAYQVLSS